MPSTLLFVVVHISLFVFFTLVTGPRRSLSLKVIDTRVIEPQILARLVYKSMVNNPLRDTSLVGKPCHSSFPFMVYSLKLYRGLFRWRAESFRTAARAPRGSGASSRRSYTLNPAP